VAASVDENQRVGRADLAMNLFAEQAVDVLLAGHLHMSHSAGTGPRYAMGGYEALVVSAGTATSTRGRGEANSFNVLRLDKQRVEVERMEWAAAGGSFVTASNEVFERTQDGWRQVDGSTPPGALAP
jgi:3',5'-cyclic AMP phosphodiesterase CpdA